jgi:hypothetical protein
VYKQFGDFEYMALALGISLPFLFVPLLFPSAAEKNTPITERYFFKVPYSRQQHWPHLRAIKAQV